ncbi:MAG: gluconate 2-dehydrogenase subunit 3 family protein, partial [Actinomycetota bacterium]|nr:gluconate 2-dehydrogenase subunit 3 family protein [Actinomycetota bacterium]
MEEQRSALIVLNSREARTAAAIFERFFPADENGPGATEIGVLTYVDRALAGAYRDEAEPYRLGLAALDRVAHLRYGSPLAECDPGQQDALVAGLEQGELP